MLFRTDAEEGEVVPSLHPLPSVSDVGLGAYFRTTHNDKPTKETI